jgi:hypothetical protein
MKISLASLLTVAFVTLKLCGVIHWDWLWVLSPLWIPLVILAILYAFIGLVAVKTNRV